jgi:hypothetical protein
MRELLARQVMWAIRANDRPVQPPRELAQQYTNQGLPPPKMFDMAVPFGETPSGSSWHSWQRMSKQFQSGLTGMRALQLTAWFGLELARPATVTGLLLDLAEIKSKLDQCSGAPAESQLLAFNQHARKVMAAGSWAQVLANLRAAVWVDRPEGASLRPAANHVWVAALRQAVVDSWVAGYHHTPVPWGKGPPRPPAHPIGRIGSGNSRARWVYAPDERRVAQAQQALGGSMWVNWDGPCKPCVALE